MQRWAGIRPVLASATSWASSASLRCTPSSSASVQLSNDLLAHQRGDSLKLGLSLHIGFVRMERGPPNNPRAVVAAVLLADRGNEHRRLKSTTQIGPLRPIWR